MSTTPETAAQQPTLAPLGFAERRAYAELATTHADERGMLQISANTLLRLLATAGQVELHQRREEGFTDLAKAWTNPDSPDDYHDAASELTAILQDEHYGDPAYQEFEMEHDGQGWRTPSPPLDRPAKRSQDHAA